MKRLTLVDDTMVAGKAATCTELSKLFDPNVFLGRDWYWMISPVEIDMRAITVLQAAKQIRNVRSPGYNV
jgi:hypothetical protein